MSKITICGGSITNTSTGKTTFEVTNGDFDSYAARYTLLEGEESINYHDYEPSEAEKDTEDFRTGVKIIASIFFDGTNNNRNNTEQRLGNTDVYKKMWEKGGSYDNYYSNIAIMEKMKINDPKSRIVSKYIEGEGTEDNQKGDTQGAGFGSGKTGIPLKVEKGTAEIIAEINKAFSNEEEFVKELIIDVFGFSRGAAAARSFINTQKASLQKKYPKTEIKYRFVGLFDTVSSYEPEGNFSVAGSAIDHNFYNDVEELQLQLGGIPEKVVHLTAADEYRENFALTNINSSILAGVGYEVQLPGAHSDIGGGYEETKTIERRKYFGKFIQTNSSERFYYHQLIEKGWYDEKQLELSPNYASFFGTRKIANHYQFIPLSIMMEMAKKYGTKFLTFDDDNEFQKFKVVPNLDNIKNALQNYVLQNDSASKRVLNLKPLSELKALRKNHLHISMDAQSLTMNPNLVNGKAKRHIIDA